MKGANLFSTRREVARADQARRILVLSHNIPLGKLTFGELTDLFAVRGTGEGGLPDDKLAKLENRIIEIKQEMGDFEKVDQNRADEPAR